MKQQVIFRILDANLNRLKEALRVIEEIPRFERNHKSLSQSAKRLRHEVEKILQSSPVPYRKLLAARDSRRDVGRNSLIRDKRKISLNDLLIANFKRAEESVRVLEEFFKLLSENTSKKFQRLRFQIYTLEKQILE